MINFLVWHLSEVSLGSSGSRRWAWHSQVIRLHYWSQKRYPKTKISVRLSLSWPRITQVTCIQCMDTEILGLTARMPQMKVYFKASQNNIFYVSNHYKKINVHESCLFEIFGKVRKQVYLMLSPLFLRAFKSLTMNENLWQIVYNVSHSQGFREYFLPPGFNGTLVHRHSKPQIPIQLKTLFPYPLVDGISILVRHFLPESYFVTRWEGRKFRDLRILNLQSCTDVV